jgi:hypothetical protein
MSAFPSASLSLLLLGGRRRPRPQPKRKRGRPRKPSAPSLLLAAPSPNAPGHPQKFIPEVEAWFVAEIDRWRAVLADRGERVSDARALQLSIQNYYFKRYEREGRPRLEAVRLARKMAVGPLYRTRRSHLSRLRRRAKTLAI